LGTRHAEVAEQVLLGVAATLVAEPDNRAATEGTEATDQRLVITEGAVATELHHVLEQFLHVVERCRTVRVAREPHAFHRGQLFDLLLLGRRLIRWVLCHGSSPASAETGVCSGSSDASTVGRSGARPLG